PRPLKIRCRYSAGESAPPLFAAPIHQLPERTCLKENLPSCPEVVVMLSPPARPHSVFRISTAAPGTGSLVPRIVTIPSTVAVPGGSGCCGGCCTTPSITKGPGLFPGPTTIKPGTSFGGRGGSGIGGGAPLP